ncbi:aquaporin [Lyngbya aestuarii]|uniref:aquaporin n=1 Tax=Lyngbya aestuarii TaxID=118322 RepID=UPI0008FF457D|nr:aquaporin [Lyngbya aestuarii]
MSLTKRCIAEFIGTFWLVFGGCGSAILLKKLIDSARVKRESVVICFIPLFAIFKTNSKIKR